MAPKHLLDMLVREYFAPRLSMWSGGRGNGAPVLDSATYKAAVANLLASATAAEPVTAPTTQATVVGSTMGGFGPFVSQKVSSNVPPLSRYRTTRAGVLRLQAIPWTRHPTESMVAEWPLQLIDQPQPSLTLCPVLPKLN